MQKKSMFDEKKEFIAERLADGKTAKEILSELGEDWYCYDSLYRYIRKNFGKLTKKRIECRKCENLVWMDAPYTEKMIPVCPVKNKVFTKTLIDCPYQCNKFVKG